MKKFKIFTDSACDLPISYINEKNIPFAKLSCTYDNKTYFDNFGQDISFKDFFDNLRNGIMPLTSQPSVEEFYNKFLEIVKNDEDILYICVSSGLSGTENSANIAKKMILDDYPNSRIEIINALSASLGQGLVVIKAIELQEAGNSLDEVISHILELRKHLTTFMTVDDLHHLKRGGRISSASAMIGIVLHIKPILALDSEGKIKSIGKARGRKASILKLAQLVCENIKNPENQILGIAHGDSLEDALSLKKEILKKINVKDVVVNCTGMAVGTHGGPNNLAVFFLGNKI